MSKEKSDEYWQGYIQKQNESMEICKICRYRTKFRELEKQLADSTPKSVIREKIEQIKVKGSEAKKTKENVMFYQGYYIALEEILKEREK